ncbi:uncharacterized protein LOC142883380 isoform X1 [Nelusetta ayraudi]|uniref:uncharacterized protein LOC142883380 isoform X1 n=1 Tax=Nelusetta ayraudi TaxID=303726 RepID=UPI003F71C3E0
MEDGESSDGLNGHNYKKLFSEEDSSGDEQPSGSEQEQRQVFVSMVRREPRVKNKVVAYCLAVLAIALLVVDIGLGVFYNKLTTGQRTVMDINSELIKLQTSHKNAIQRRDDAKKELASERNHQKQQKWEMENLVRREKDFKEQLDKVHMEIVALRSHMPVLEEGCRRCLTGWIFMNSMCYYLPFSDTAVRKTWQEARRFCQKYKSDLAVIDNNQKHLAITELINRFQNPSRLIAHSGFWIGLHDTEVEGIWRWLNGRNLDLPFWNDGEPNDLYGEDCAATYPRENPFKAWNDAPCTYHLRWICEMAGKPFEM